MKNRLLLLSLLVVPIFFGCLKQRNSAPKVSDVSIFIPPFPRPLDEGTERWSGLTSMSANDYKILAVPPTSISGFTCLGVNVTGEGIVSNKNLGEVSNLVTPTQGGSLTVKVPVGLARLFQVLGIVSDTTCGDASTLSSTTLYPYIFVLGSATSDVLTDTSLSIALSYDISTARDLRTGELATTTVTPSGTNVTVSPSTVQTVSIGSTKAFTVTANTGYTVSSTVGGTCPAGSWSGSVYTTGSITGACTVSFSGSAINYTVTPSGTNVTVSPSAAQTVAYGSTKSFTVTGNSGYSASTTVGGTCPAGSWSGSVYTTGTITGNCTLSFSGIVAYSISATVTLNSATGLVIVNNATNPTITNDPTTTTPISSNGTYTFTSSLPTNATYNVTVSTQPTNYTCTVKNGSGTMGSSNVSNISVTCIKNCTCPNGYTVDDSKLFCSSITSSTNPGAFVPVQTGDTNGAYGPSGGYAFSFSQSTNYPYKDTSGSLADSLGNAISRITPLAGTFWTGRLNAISIKPNPEQIGPYYELSFCLNTTVNGEYVFGIAADNGMGFSVGGKRIFESSLTGSAQSSTFDNWWLGSITLSSGSYPVNFLWNNAGGSGALGFEFYQNSMDEVKAATALTDLTVIARSSTYIGQSKFAEQGTTCPSGASYNACSGKCEVKTTTSCQ